MNNFLGSWLGPGPLCLEDLIKQVCRKLNYTTIQHAMYLSKGRPMCMVHYRPGGTTPNSGLYKEAPPERGTFFRLQVYKRVGISQVEVYKRVGKSVI